MFKFKLLGLICVVALVYGDDDHGQHIVSLTKSTFPKGSADTPLLVMFFAPWCGHCKRLIPTFDQLAKKYNVDEAKKSITIAKVDCTVETTLCGDHGVSGYPTLKYFDTSMEEAKYDKARDKESFERYIAEKLGRPEPEDADKPFVKIPKQIQMVTAGLAELTEDNWGTAMASQTRFFVMFYAPWCGHCKSLKPTWLELARLYYDKKVEDFMLARLDCTANSKICGQHEVKGYPTLMWFAGGRMLEKYMGARDEPSLKAFIQNMAAVVDPSKYSSNGMVPEDDSVPYTEADPKDSNIMIDNGLHTLIESTFSNAVATGHTFVKFYAPWCGHCKNLAPTWEKLAAAHASDENFKIAKVDCTSHSAVCSRYSVRGYPTLLWFHKGEHVDNYSGQRDEDSLEAYIKAQIALLDGLPEDKTGAEPVIEQGVLELTSVNFADTIKEETTFVMFYAPWCGHCKKLKPTWNELGEFFNGYEDIKIAKVDCTANQDVCEEYEIKGYPTLLFFVDGEKQEKHGGARELESLKNSVKKTLALAVRSRLDKEEKATETVDKTEGSGKVEVLTNENFDATIAKSFTFVKFYAPWCGHCKRLAPTWEELAAEVKSNGDITIAEIDCTIPEDKPVCSKYEVRGFPSLLLFRDGEKVEKYSGGRELDAFKSYLDDKVPAKKAEPVKEEPKPTGGVVELTADNFAEVTGKGQTFVKFYAPWCGHCKNLAPTWDELAAKEKNVRIAKLDCTEHRSVCSDEGVSGFPTLMFFSNGKNLGEHNGGRSIEALEGFMASKKHDEL